MFYVRSRFYYEYIDGRWRLNPLYDLTRIERQQDFIRRVAAEAIKTSIANPITGSDVSGKAISKLQIDRDLDREDMNNPADPMHPGSRRGSHSELGRAHADGTAGAGHQRPAAADAEAGGLRAVLGARACRYLRSRDG